MNIIQSLQQFARDEEGASAVEYGLVLAVIVLALAAGAGKLATAINGALEAVGTHVGTVVK